MRLGGLTAEETLVLERPAMTYVRSQLGDRLQRHSSRGRTAPGRANTAAAGAVVAGWHRRLMPSWRQVKATLPVTSSA
ncbi:MAG TPA: hypothetical protein VGK55_12335 [Actinomycetes bacterium]